MNNGTMTRKRVDINRVNQGGNALVERYSGFSRSEQGSLTSRSNAITGLGTFGGLALVTSIAKAEEVTGSGTFQFKATVGSANGGSFDEAVAKLRALECKNGKKIDAVDKKVDGVSKQVTGVQTSVDALQGSVNTLTTGLGEVKGEIGGIKSEVNGGIWGFGIGGLAIAVGVVLTYLRTRRIGRTQDAHTTALTGLHDDHATQLAAVRELLIRTGGPMPAAPAPGAAAPVVAPAAPAAAAPGAAHTP